MKDKFFKDLQMIQKEMVKILGDVSTLASNPINLSADFEDTWQPHCDIFEKDDGFVILVELAGVDREALEISSTTKYIKISGVRYFAFKTENICYYNMEIDSGHFERKIYFPDVPIDKENPSVSFENGILHIEYPLVKTEERIIPINEE